jgi:hypothetical protein
MVSALVIGASACGSDGGHFDGKEPAEIAEEARKSMLTLTSMTLEAEVTNGDSTTEMKTSFTEEGECNGTIVLDGAEAEFLSVGGNTYFKATDAFWDAEGQDGAAMNALINGRWILYPEGQSNYEAFCSMESFLSDLEESDTEDKDWKSIDGEKVNGTTAVGVSRTDEDGTSNIYIADAKDAYILKMTNDGEGGGNALFTDFNKKFKFEAPAEDEVVDFAALQQS